MSSHNFSSFRPYLKINIIKQLVPIVAKYLHLVAPIAVKKMSLHTYTQEVLKSNDSHVKIYIDTYYIIILIILAEWHVNKKTNPIVNKKHG